MARGRSLPTFFTMKTSATVHKTLLAFAALGLAVGCSRANDSKNAARPATVAEAAAASGLPAPATPAPAPAAAVAPGAPVLTAVASTEKAAPAAAKETPGTPGKADAGKAVYLRVCFACHQPTGLGLPGAFPPLAGAAMVNEADPGKIIRIVLHGLIGPIEVKGVTYNSMMPPHAPQLKDQEIADVLTYVRNEWGNKAAPVTVEAVAKIRATVNRATPWTWAELNK